MPLGNFGHPYSSWFVEAGGQPLPEPVLQAGRDGDDIWLHERVRQTHDLWEWCAASP